MWTTGHGTTPAPARDVQAVDLVRAEGEGPAVCPQPEGVLGHAVHGPRRVDDRIGGRGTPGGGVGRGGDEATPAAYWAGVSAAGAGRAGAVVQRFKRFKRDGGGGGGGGGLRGAGRDLALGTAADTARDKKNRDEHLVEAGLGEEAAYRVAEKGTAGLAEYGR